MDAESYFFSALLNGGKVTDLRRVKPEYLSPTWRKVHQFISEFNRDNHRLPRVQTVSSECAVILPDPVEDIGYYVAALRAQAMRATMEKHLEKDVVDPLIGGQADAALKGLKATVSKVSRDFREEEDNLILDDLGANIDERIAAYNIRKARRTAMGLPLPFQTMTHSTGGIRDGEAWALVARPNMGKTWGLVLLGSFLQQAGYRVLFASMETPPHNALPINKNHRVIRGRCFRCGVEGVTESEACPAASIRQQRLNTRFDAIGARVSAFRLDKGILQPQEERDLHNYYSILREPVRYGWGSLRIVSAPAIRTAGDVEAEIQEYRPDIVLWDSAYLAANRKGKSNENAADLVVSIKDMCSRYGIPIVVSWHFNREVGEKDTYAPLNCTALTDELPRVFDVVMGLFRPPEVYEAGEALWQSIKIRDGVRMPELKTHFKLKDCIRFDEITYEGAG